MAIRNIVKDGDEILHKKCRNVEKFDDKLATLLDDMAETMHKADGVGLAGPQVGMLRRVVVIDIGEGVIELVNPEIIETSGEQETAEGCLSFPGEYGITKAFCHEIDHLNGIVFKDIVVRMLDPEELG